MNNTNNKIYERILKALFIGFIAFFILGVVAITLGNALLGSAIPFGVSIACAIAGILISFKLQKTQKLIKEQQQVELAKQKAEEKARQEAELKKQQAIEKQKQLELENQAEQDRQIKAEQEKQQAVVESKQKEQEKKQLEQSQEITHKTAQVDETREQEIEHKNLKKIEETNPLISKFLIPVQKLDDNDLISALLELPGYESSSSKSQSLEKIESIDNRISEAKRAGKSKEKIEEWETLKKHFCERIQEKEEKSRLVAEKIKSGVSCEIKLVRPQKEEEVKNVFSTYYISVLTNETDINKYKKQEEQESQQFYEYLISNGKCKLAIENFTKKNSKTIENRLMGIEYDDIFIETIRMLTNVLTENTSFDFNTAYQVTHKAIISTLLNQWMTNFKEQNGGFYQQINKADKDESVKLFANNFDKAKTLQKTMYSFFLLLHDYDMKVDFNVDISSLHKAYEKFESEINAAYDTIQEKVVYENFKGALFTYIDPNEDGESFTIDDIDLMDGTEFEHYIAKLFTKMGYITEVTKHSGDQGIDVIAKKGNTSIGIQAKCYSGTVGNSAVQ